MKHLLYILFFTLLLNSCNKVENKPQEKVDAAIEKTDSFDYKLRNEPKYFLKFWKNMSKNDFDRVKKLLVREGKLDDIYGIKYGKSSTLIEPIILEDKVRGVKLLSVDSRIYSLYKEKYNLPELVEKSTIGICFKGDNPYYLNPNYKDSNKIDSNTKEVSVGEILHNTNLNEFNSRYKALFLPEFSIELENDKANIILSDKTKNIGYEVLGGAFGDSPEYASYPDFFYPKKDNSEVGFPRKDLTKYRYAIFTDTPNIVIEYYPIGYLKDRNEMFKKKREAEKETERKTTDKKAQELKEDI